MKKKILIVEDDNFLQKALGHALLENDFDIISAVSGEQAVPLAKNAKPDLILLDIILPKKDGFVIMEELKNDSAIASIPVIFITNLGQKEDVKKGLDLGAKGYIIKAHFKIADIIDKINEVLK
ncbi:MAG: response regulator [Candidatus Buchananbacteria bacterium]|nr:response regulator [Candidatus Buchananbacteria bacterium]